jgi:hypothetical protein
MRLNVLITAFAALVSWHFGDCCAQNWSSSASSASSNPIPGSRRVDWNLAGIPGGIPNRTIVGAIIDPKIYGNGLNDATRAIQTAINSCPENQVVYLPTGVYLVRAGLGSPTKNNITIRGDGPNKTIIKAALTTRSKGVFSFGEAVWNSGNYPANLVVNITSGSTKDSTRIVVDNASKVTTSGLRIGDLVQISELNDPSFVNSVGSTGSFAGFTDRDHNGQRNLQQIVRVTAVSGNTISFYPALYWTYSANLRPQAALIPGTIHGIGLEGFKILDTAGNNDYHVVFWNSDRCWIKNIESAAANWHAFLYQTLNIELRDSSFHDAFGGYNHDSGYGFEARFSSGFKFENNILNDLYASMIVAGGSSGGVVGYNYIVNTHNNDPSMLIMSIDADHGAHPMMNLYEGNTAAEFQSDYYWGSSSHQTLFRNRFFGTDNGVSNNQKPISLDRFSRYFSVVGNVLGSAQISSGWGAGYPLLKTRWLYEIAQVYSFIQPVIYRLGYPNMGNNNFSTISAAPADYRSLDPMVKSTLLRGGNYDFATNSIIWQGNAPDSVSTYLPQQVLPPSLYLGSKPSWFGNVPFPPIGPDVAGYAQKIPAQVRFEGGVH